MKGINIALFFCIFLYSCGSSRLSDPIARKAIRKTQLYNDIPEENIKVVKSLKGISCGKTWADHSSKSDALQSLKSKTAYIKSPVDGITNIACERTGFSWKYNCNNSWACYGDAFVFTEKFKKEEMELDIEIDNLISSCNERAYSDCFKVSLKLYDLNDYKEAYLYMQKSCVGNFKNSCKISEMLLKEEQNRKMIKAVRENNRLKSEMARENAESQARLMMQNTYNDIISKSTPTNVNINHSGNVKLKSNCITTKDLDGNSTTVCR